MMPATKAGLLFVLIALGAAAGPAGCARCDAPPAPVVADASAPSPPVIAARDAAVDATDARGDAADAGGPGHRATSRAPGPRAGGGSNAIKVEGKLAKADAEKVLRAGFARLRACNPTLPGRVTFRLELDDRGRVTLGEVVHSTLATGDSEMCMVRATRDFKFPAAPGGATVTFSLTFGR